LLYRKWTYLYDLLLPGRSCTHVWIIHHIFTYHNIYTYIYTCTYIICTNVHICVSHYSVYRNYSCGCNKLQSPWSIQASTRFQGAIGYVGPPPQAPEAVETVDAEQDSQGNSNSVEMATC
jgi:hypothetical protein